MKKIGFVCLITLVCACLLCAFFTVGAGAQSTSMTAAEVASALSSGRYTLTSDITVSDDACVTLPMGEYTLYLDGHTLSCDNETHPLFTLGIGVTLNIYADEDQTAIGTGRVCGADTLFKVDGGTLNVYGLNAEAEDVLFRIIGGTLSVRGGNYTAPTAVLVIGNSRTVLYNGTFQATSAIESTAGSVAVLGGTYTGTLSDTDDELKIAAGTFSVDPSAFLAASTVDVRQAGGIYTVDPTALNVIVEVKADNQNPLAFYDDLGSAVWGVTEGNTVVLLKDFAIPANSILYVHRTFCLDLNGKKISFAAHTRKDAGIDVQNSAQMTVIDSDPTARRTFKNNNGLWVEDAAGDITVYGGVISGETSAPLIKFTQSNTGVIWTAGSIVGNTSTAVMFKDTTTAFAMTGGAICGNTGHSLHLTTGCAYLSGGTVDNVFINNTDAVLDVSGDVKITRLQLKNEATVTVDELTEGAAIGIRCENDSKIFAYNVKLADRKYFTNEYIDQNNAVKDCIVKYVPEVTGDTPVPSYFVLEKPLEVTLSGYEGAYDGTSHSVGTPTCNLSQNIVYVYSTDGKTFTSTVPSITDIGETTVTVKATRYGWEEATGTCKLTVKKRSVTLTSATDSKKFDLTALTNHTVTVSGDGFMDGDGATYTVTGTQTDVGSSKNTFTYTLNDGTNADYYDVTKVEGDLTVTVISDTPIVLQAGNDTKLYDGTAAATASYTYTFTEGVLLDTDTLTVTFAGQTAGAGTTDMQVVSLKIMRGSVDVTRAYVFGTHELGTMTVNKRSVTLTSATDSKKFDLAALTNHTVTVSGDGFLAGEGATYDVTGTQTDVGSSKNVFTYTLNDGTNAGNYDVTKVEGDLTVTVISDTPIVIQAGSGTKMYDGAVLTTTNYTYTDGVLLATDTLTATLTGSITNAGTMDVTVTSWTVMRGSVDVTQAYAFGTPVAGKLTVTKRSVILTSASETKTYDTTPLVNGTVVVSGDGFVFGEGATYDVTGTQTAIGSSKNVFTYTLDPDTSADNYDVTKVEGTLTVMKLLSDVPIVICAKNSTKNYDGTALTATEYSYTGGVLVAGDTLEVVLAGSITNVGQTEATVVSWKVLRGSADVTPAYVFGTPESGTLTVEKRSVTLTSANDTKKYDAAPLVNDTVVVSGDGFIEGEGATYTVTGTQTAVGSSKNVFTYVLNPGTNAGNYDFTIVEGTLSVTLISDTPIAIRVENQTKKYDGSPLSTVYDYTASLAAGDTLVVSFPDSITNVGRISATVTYQVLRGNTDVTDGYLFEKPVCGTLTVTPRIITVTSRSVSKVYDGTPLSSLLVSVSGDGFAPGDRIAFTASASLTEPGTMTNVITCDVSEGTDLNNYDLQISEGTLTVLAKQITANLDGFCLESNAGLDFGVTLSVEENVEVTTNREPGLEIKAVYDLTLLRDGAAVQPDGSVKITIPIPQKLQSEKNLLVCYIDEDGNVKKLNTERKNNTLTFTTNHFSLYAIARDVSEDTLSAIPTNYWKTIVLVESVVLVAVILLSAIRVSHVKRKARNGYYS